MQWDDELLRYFNVPRAALPEVKPSASEFGVTKGLDFLPDGVAIRGVAGDQQAALFGQGVSRRAKEMHVRHRSLLPAPHRRQRGVIETQVADDRRRHDRRRSRSTHSKARCSSPGPRCSGSAMGFTCSSRPADVEQLAKESNLSEPVLFVPEFVGLGAPHWVPEARGVIFGLTRATTGADLGRAALEGVAFQVADLIDAADKDLSNENRARALKVDGGMARNDWFLQFQADVLGRPVARAGQSEATALGAAFLAAVRADLADESKLAALMSGSQQFALKLDAAARTKKLATWRKAVQAVIGFYSQ